MGRGGAGESRKLSLLWGDWVEPFASQTLGIGWVNPQSEAEIPR
jgi:hypothetical protein